jgi:hypothetical protein
LAFDYKIEGENEDELNLISADKIHLKCKKVENNAITDNDFNFLLFFNNKFMSDVEIRTIKGETVSICRQVQIKRLCCFVV